MENPFEELKRELSDIKRLITEKQEPEQYLTTKQVAALLQVNESTVIHLRNIGTLKSYGLKKMVRYRRSEVMAALVQINGRAA